MASQVSHPPFARFPCRLLEETSPSVVLAVEMGSRRVGGSSQVFNSRIGRYKIEDDDDEDEESPSRTVNLFSPSTMELDPTV